MLNVHAATMEARYWRLRRRCYLQPDAVQLSPGTGYVEGEITFVDGSRLVFFDFLRQVSAGLDREKYRYHFMDTSNQLIFRYDNAAHHPAVAVSPS